MAAVSACSSGPTAPGGPPPEITRLPRALTVAEGAIVSAGNRFAFDLLRQVQGAAPDSSLFLSPLSASMALGMALAGSDGETFAQMREMLGFPGLGREEIGAAYKGLISLLRGLDPGVQFEIGNSVWIREEFPVQRSFLDFVADRFDARAQTLDFASPAAAGVINQWVSQRTRGRIPSIVEPPIDPLTVMFLINAIHFKGDWRERFDRGRTRAEPFHGIAGSAPVPLMQRTGKLRYTETDDLQVVEVPYGGDAFAMTVLLPRGGMDLKRVVAELDEPRFQALVATLTVREVELFLPRFRMEYHRTLNDDLKTLGMTHAFDPERADFTRIHPAARELGLHVTSVIQKTFVQVDEEGTEAAAATSVEVGIVSMPVRPVVRVDRPFLFVLRERLSGTVLFVGTVLHPPSG